MADTLEERIARAVTEALRTRLAPTEGTQESYVGEVTPDAPTLPRVGNRLKKRMAAGGSVIGTVVTIDSSTVAELLANVGFDFLWFDLEHGPLTLETTQAMMAAMQGTDCTPLIRVEWNDHALIKRTLDTGPMGIVVPMVSSAEEAERAVKACKYPPQGIRGAGVARAQKYGMDLDAYLKHANEEVMVIVQIEDVPGVEAVDDILKVEGVDLVFIGPFDLSGSMGMLGQVEHPKVQAAIEKVLASCQRARVPIGIFAGSPEKANREISRGFQFILMGVDVYHMVNCTKALLAQIKRP